MLNVVLDTNVLVAALQSKNGASNTIVSLIEKQIFTIHLSVPLVMEYEDVLKRPKHRGTFTEEEIESIIDELCFWGQKHNVWYLWRPMLTDANDEFVAELAVAASAEYIVTFNIKDFKGMEAFGVKVVQPSTFLHLLRKESQ